MLAVKSLSTLEVANDTNADEHKGKYYDTGSANGEWIRNLHFCILRWILKKYDVRI